VALNQKVLLVSFGASDKKHNERLAKLLSQSFMIENFAFTDLIPGDAKEKRYRVVLSALANLASVPTIGFMVALHQVLGFSYQKRKGHNYLPESIQNYFDDHKNLMTLILHLNRTLRKQKVRVIRANQVINLAVMENVDCVLLPEDSNFYSSGIIIEGLQKLAIKVGVVDFTIGKEAEFESARTALVPDRNYLPHLLFAKIFLKSSVRHRWIKSKEFINVFPGSLETTSHNSLTPAFTSGLADFYLSSDKTELKYLERQANIKAQVCLIEPIEVTLSKLNAASTAEKNVFGLFLPPNQLTDPEVVSRISGTWGNEYETIIMKVIEDVQKNCNNTESLVVFPHPRTYLSEPILINKISAKFEVSNDFAEYLGVMRSALIFSSSVFSALLAANIKVFNLDLYNYGYKDVFPFDNHNFVTINEIKDIKNFSHCSEYSQSQPNAIGKPVFKFLEEFL
jgi:hypothetical protein